MRELAADLAAKRLKGVIPPGSLELATRGIRECNDRATGLIEAQLLAEADHLEEIGPQAIRLMERKNRSEGKTLDDLIATWERQEEYHYWQARIKESFRFPSVRRLAERRLDALRRFMTDLRAVVRLDDLVALAGTEGNTARARAARD
jgi:hypothetical protein